MQVPVERASWTRALRASVLRMARATGPWQQTCIITSKIERLRTERPWDSTGMITSRTTTTLVLLCLISVHCLCGPTNTLAQQAPAGVILRSLEREDRPPELPGPTEKPVIEQEEQKRREAQAASAEKIPVRSFRIEGVTLLGADEVRAIVAPWESKDLSLEDIKGVAEGITAAYARQGYITAFAFVPAQEVRDGIVQIRAIEGRAGAITAEGNRSYSTPFVEGHLASVREDPSIRLQTLERALLTLNSYPEMDAKAFLKAGKDPGTTDIIVRVSDRRPVNAGIAYDNFGQDYISRSRASVTFDAGNLAASGDMLSFRGADGPRPARPPGSLLRPGGVPASRRVRRDARRPFRGRHAIPGPKGTRGPRHRRSGRHPERLHQPAPDPAEGREPEPPVHLQLPRRLGAPAGDAEKRRTDPGRSGSMPGTSSSTGFRETPLSPPATISAGGTAPGEILQDRARRCYGRKRTSTSTKSFSTPRARRACPAAASSFFSGRDSIPGVALQRREVRHRRPGERAGIPARHPERRQRLLRQCRVRSCPPSRPAR